MVENQHSNIDFYQNDDFNPFQDKNDVNLQKSMSSNKNNLEIPQPDDIRSCKKADISDQNEQNLSDYQINEDQINSEFQTSTNLYNKADDDNSSQDDTAEFAYQMLDGEDNVEVEQEQQEDKEQQFQNVEQDFQQSIGPNLDEFERLMLQVSSARERFRGLPDDVRREAASQLALQLAEAFGIADEE
eukprot:TRINITY_DN4946_c0_g2_i5.p3 TRINITY_DN4946_c0_g2~~TRINITY_DN4946_c0_g2_i5.p3  ORF type:complete len:187 (-),score=39.18 TRINITY_DN4946_c0_g2_i5:1047-1607(-)